ncbi:glycoside hydrolase family 127 protein [Metabacillus halosaccharovorans]|uniref:glycoside hydrolase family 127 protein n=1 Tax=Metabacillus halosaccharovorans TaxID=930124 RepID=UPI00203F0640|nr:beta-L-arabinofuranosidase domain-containing protein [Metabacillus halosaccharovorans]MCM3443650.1 glycoside hydrolase family 127 protein [Metabacillus halosaccharovorans]
MKLRYQNSYQTVPLQQVRIKDTFWTKYRKLVKDTVIPYQWEALNDRIKDAEPSFAIRNFKIAAGRIEGEFGGMVFQDSDVAKWLEAVGYSLSIQEDPDLEKTADEVIDLVVEAQHEDGYLNTYYTIKEPGKRWTNLYECHEMYCAGHMIEAAVAYYRSTGKRKLLDAMCRFADHIEERFGVEPGKIRGYDGHQEIELALIKLYQVTKNEKYLKLSQFFIDERGKDPHFFVEEWEERGKTTHWGGGIIPAPKYPTYNQAHVPVREQKEAVGHSVRAVYMYSAMADLVKFTNDESLYEACNRLWKNMINKQMYITGGIGSTYQGEAFTFDYDLPNDTNYAETCASIGLIFFAQRMLQLEAKGEYADAMEKALYNNVIAGMSVDGKHYFYVNPLEVLPEASEKDPGKRHVKPVRQKWYGCSCCPPNVARLIASLGEYIYTKNEDTLFTHLYIGSETNVTLAQGKVNLVMDSEYEWNGKVQISVNPEQTCSFTLAYRVPGWSSGVKFAVNGQEINPEIVDGYAYIHRQWHKGDQVELQMDIESHRLYAHPEVRANAGKTVLQRGPFVYCLEEADNGKTLGSIMLPAGALLMDRFDPLILDGVVIIEADAVKEEKSDWEQTLYRKKQKVLEQKRIKAIPYYAWGNREPGEMSVWIRERQ